MMMKALLIGAVATVVCQAEPILEVAQANGNFGSLVGAINLYAEDAASVFAQSDVTIFAPVDAAIDSAIPTLVQDIGSLPTVLAGHVVRGYYTAEDLLSMMTADDSCVELQTIANTTLAITAMDHGDHKMVMVNKNIMVDMMAYNLIGDNNTVLHGIDKVIFPNDANSMCPTDDDTDAPTPTPSAATAPLSSSFFAAATITIIGISSIIAFSF